MTTKRKLRCWNGRGWLAYQRVGKDAGRWDRVRDKGAIHVNVCAYSAADALRVFEEYTGDKGGAHEFKNYFSECWGNSMRGITPERGLWVEFEYNTPERVL